MTDPTPDSENEIRKDIGYKPADSETTRKIREHLDAQTTEPADEAAPRENPYWPDAQSRAIGSRRVLEVRQALNSDPDDPEEPGNNPVEEEPDSPNDD